MLALDSGDKIQGDASTAAKVDYSLHGLDANAIKQLADGQLADATGDLYTADSADVVATIVLVNTHDSALTCNLFILPSAGTARRLIPKDTSLAAGNSLHTDGKSLIVFSATGGAVSAYAAHASSHEKGGADEISVAGLSGELADDQPPKAHKDSHDPNDGSDPLDTANAAEIAGVQAAGTGTSHSLARADHAHQIQAAITDDHILTVDDAAAADDDFARFTAAGIEGLSVADTLTALNVASGADVTGSNAPQAHKDSHDPNDGGDPLDCAAAGEIVGVAAAAEGSAHSFARSDHTHQVQHSIADNHVLTVDDAAAADNDFARFTADGIEGLTVAEAITALLAAALPENVGIILDAALSADEKFSGIIEAGTAGATVDFGDLLYHDVTAGEWLLAKADAAATSKGKLGINVTVAQAGDGDPITVLLWGKVRSDDDYAFTVDAPVFISAATAGDMTSTAPTGTTNFVVRIVGYGNTADELFFCPDNTYLELA